MCHIKLVMEKDICLVTWPYYSENLELVESQISVVVLSTLDTFITIYSIFKSTGYTIFHLKAETIPSWSQNYTIRLICSFAANYHDLNFPWPAPIWPWLSQLVEQQRRAIIRVRDFFSFSVWVHFLFWAFTRKVLFGTFIDIYKALQHTTFKPSIYTYMILFNNWK